MRNVHPNDHFNASTYLDIYARTYIINNARSYVVHITSADEHHKHS